MKNKISKKTEKISCFAGHHEWNISRQIMIKHRPTASGIVVEFFFFVCRSVNDIPRLPIWNYFFLILNKKHLLLALWFFLSTYKFYIHAHQFWQCQYFECESFVLKFNFLDNNIKHHKIIDNSLFVDNNYMVIHCFHLNVELNKIAKSDMI